MLLTLKRAGVPVLWSARVKRLHGEDRVQSAFVAGKKIPKSDGKGVEGKRFLSRDPVIRAALAVFLVVAICVGGFLCDLDIKYDRIIARRFRIAVSSATPQKSTPFPRRCRTARRSTPKKSLHRSAALDTPIRDDQSELRQFHLLKTKSKSLRGRSPITAPKPRSSSGWQGRRITSKGNELSAYELEPQLITALFDAEQRSKRELVKYDQIPPVMTPGCPSD